MAPRPRIRLPVYVHGIVPLPPAISSLSSSYVALIAKLLRVSNTATALQVSEH